MPMQKYLFTGICGAITEEFRLRGWRRRYRKSKRRRTCLPLISIFASEDRSFQGREREREKRERRRRRRKFLFGRDSYAGFEYSSSNLTFSFLECKQDVDIHRCLRFFFVSLSFSLHCRWERKHDLQDGKKSLRG